MRTPDGQWLWIDVRSSVLARDASGAVSRVLGVSMDVTKQHRHAAAMAAAAAALDHAEVNERRRIGRELHDSTSQFLVAARLGVNALAQHGGVAASGERVLEEVREAITCAQSEIRNFSYMLHPPALESEGLENCLRAFAAGFGRRTGLHISVKVARGLGRPPPRISFALYRIAQEALMNVYRHAGATHAWVRLRHIGNGISLEIEDDGGGLRGRAMRPGVGISGMEARMTQLRGELSLDTSRNGFLVRAVAPIEVAPEA
jgi:signal transduction histidine kinase